ncbi:MAG TPA: efflux RND transporter periplasmic adaptor subunit [Polyangiales bacterium]|nr:efflux RND transporter periplasmic adaptor subunit [Polyangiales bacterium]
MNGPDSAPAPKPDAARDDLGFSLPPPARVSPTTGIALGVAAIALLATIFLLGYLPRREAKQALAHDSREAGKQQLTVDVIQPKLLESTRELTLPGSIQAAAETVLYPRANGYVERFEADLGDRVSEGQLLAVIETPELDQQLDSAHAQLAAAEAALAQARANQSYALTSLERYKRLRPAGVASQQELDQHQSEATVSEANVAAARAAVDVQRAEVRRLTRVKSFSRVTAPFAGLITQRSIDRGSLVTAGNASPLFTLIVADPVRVFVQVPQDVAPSVRAGVPAKINVREYPGRSFEGKLERAAFALDSQTRTMLSEVRIPNPKGELLVGMYAEVALSLPVPHRAYEIPATALYNDANGLRVAVVNADGAIQFKTIVIERDTGATLQVASGIREGERVVRLASARLQEGMHVQVKEKEKNSGSGSKG